MARWLGTLMRVIDILGWLCPDVPPQGNHWAKVWRSFLPCLQQRRTLLSGSIFTHATLTRLSKASDKVQRREQPLDDRDGHCPGQST